MIEPLSALRSVAISSVFVSTLLVPAAGHAASPQAGGLPNVVAEIEALKAAVAALQASVPPGATTFTTTIDATDAHPFVPLVILNNGVTVSGSCNSGGVGDVFLQLGVATGNHLQVSGTKNQIGSVAPVDSDNTVSSVSGGGGSQTDFGVLARDSSTGGKFARIDVHGTFGRPSCTFWGMILPSE